jgi:hypothetical protein
VRKIFCLILVLLLISPATIISDPIAVSRTASISIPNENSTPNFNWNQGSVNTNYAALPLSFELNRGQADPSVKFVARGRGYNMLLTGQEAVLAFANDSDQHILRMKLLNSAHNPTLTGLQKLPGKVNYFIGNNRAQWHTDIPTYSKVNCADVYRGIDLVYYSVDGALEYDFVVKPGGDPNQIAMLIDGADQMEIDSAGNLVVKIPDQEIQFHAPRIYQEVNGSKQTIAGAFVLKADRQVAFHLSSYDSKLPLVIDPQLVYATYLGGSGGNGGGGGSFGGDLAARIAVDSTGSAYITGQTFSVNFPLKTPLQGRFAGSTDAFVTKLSPDGKSIIYSTYLGGSLGDGAVGIAVNPAKSAFVAGVTGSFDFPLKSPMQNTNHGGGESFVTKLSPAGNSLMYSTYLGGSGFDQVSGIEIGKGKTIPNAAYVYGSTTSTNFPLVQASQKQYGGGFRDAFVSVLNPAGTKLTFSTYAGTKNDEQFVSAALNPQRGDLYFGIKVQDDSGNQTSQLGHFVEKTGTASTKGNNKGYFYFITDWIRYFHLLYSESKDFRTFVDFFAPPEPLGLQKSQPAAEPELYASINNCVFPEGSSSCVGSGVIVTLDPDLNFKRATNFGGSNQNLAIEDQAVDSQGRVYVAGYVESRNFQTVNAIQPSSRGGISDAFLVATGPSNSQITFASYLGGSKEDVAKGVTVDPQGNIYVTGFTASTNFLQTPGAFQTKKNGPLFDAFIVKIAPN